MANIIDLTKAIRQPDVRITGTSYRKITVPGVPDMNVPAYLFPVLKHYPIVSQAVRLATFAGNTPPSAVAAPVNGGGGPIADTPYDIDVTNEVDLKLIVTGAALPLNMERTINDTDFDVIKFYHTFLEDAIRAETERQLILGDGTADTFKGLATLATNTVTFSGTSVAQRNAEVDRAADLCMRGRGRCRADLIVCNTAARRKLMADATAANRGWEDLYIPALEMTIPVVKLAQGWVPIVVSDFIDPSTPTTDIYFLVTEGENGCTWATSQGMPGVNFTKARDPENVEDWILAEQLGALLVQDDQKLVRLQNYPVAIP